MSAAWADMPAGRRTVLMFSGQGSQYYGMGRPLYDQQPIFREHLERLDRLAVAHTGVSVVERLYAGGRSASDPLSDITIANPAIFMVEYALARTLIELGLRVDMTLGASLGAFAAMAISGLLDPGEALAAVIRMANAADSDAPAGGMIAVLAPLALLDDPFLRANSDVAAINFDSHFVLSMEAGRIAGVEAHLAARDVPFQRLPVSFAFHSRAVDRLEARARAISDTIRPATGHIPFACCAHARLLTELPPAYFWTLIRRPILFRETVLGLEREQACHYIDAGPSGTLSTFLKYLLPRESAARVSQTMSPFGTDNANVAALLAAYPGPAE